MNFEIKVTKTIILISFNFHYNLKPYLKCFNYLLGGIWRLYTTVFVLYFIINLDDIYKYAISKAIIVDSFFF